MIVPVPLKRFLAYRHVARHEDHHVQRYVELLRRDNAALKQARRRLRADRFTPSGRYVLRRMVSFAILMLLFTFITIAVIEIAPDVQAIRAARQATTK